MKGFDYQGALKEGYTDEEIFSHLSQKKPKFDFQGAQDEGYSLSEINDYLSQKPERSKSAKAGRIGLQAGKGLLQSATIMPDIAAMGANAFMKAPHVAEQKYRENVFEDIERLYEQKQTGVWDEQDENLLGSLLDQVHNPEKMKPFIEEGLEKGSEINAFLAPSHAIEKGVEAATGIDTQAEGIAEKAANWIGFLKDPKNLVKAGLNPKETLKALAPTGTEILRGVGAGTALEMAEEGDFGPLGTIASMVVGDAIGGGLSGLGKAVLHPKKSLAKATALFTPQEGRALQKEIIKDFKDAGVTADIGTLTDNRFVKFIQTKLAQSGLTGDALQNLSKEITQDIQSEYKKLADGLGEARFQTLHEAGEVGKELIESAKNADKEIHSKLYESARKRLKNSSEVDPTAIGRVINHIETSLKKGALKSPEQQVVLNTLETIKKDIFDAQGKIKPANVQSLMNTKTALHDIIDYEIQGGQKQLLKTVASEIDNAIKSYGKQDAQFYKDYVQANKKFGEHAKTFRESDAVRNIIKSRDPMTLMNKMNTVQGMRDVEKALKKIPEGEKAFNDLKRLKFDEMIGKKMTDNVSEQLKTGTFANLLKNPKDKQLIAEMLGSQALSKLEKLQKVSGKLAQSAQKFMNASQSAASIVDMGLVGGVLKDVFNAISGNPWPLMKRGGTILGARSLSNLLGNTAFLKDVEEAILSAEKNDIIHMMRVGQRIESAAKAVMTNDSNEKEVPMPNQ